MLGSIYIKFEQNDQASHFFKSALERDPFNYESLFTLGALKQKSQ